ncbi:MAG TPA: peptide ABC transporter substrate-binding protein, partial [Sarcina sp.]|nr:peptide ABC transporter substrate-binding protein [Sarcina sp.]
ITVHLASDPGAPVPFEVMDMDTASLLKQISEGLVTLDENGEAVPGCAKKWSVSDHGLKWKFTLRRDLCWSDGESITAEDFENLFKKIADPSEEILYGQDLTKNIAGYEKVLEGDPDALEVSAEDDRTLVIRLSSPDSAFARKCASWTLLPIRELM